MLKKILLVEDDPATSLLQTKQLESLGYNVHAISNGEEAVTYIQKNRKSTDIILMDMELGNGMDGTQTAKKILTNIDIPIIFLTGHADPELLEKAKTITSYGYIIKGSGLHVIDTCIKMASNLYLAKKNTSENEIKFRSLFENSRDAIGVSVDGVYTFINPACLRMFGYEKQKDLIGKSILNLIAPEKKKSILDFIKKRKINNTQTAFETRGLRQNGTKFDMEVMASTFELNEQIHTLFIIRDITEQKSEKKRLILKLGLLENLNKIDNILLYQNDLKQSMSDVLQETLNNFGVDRAWFLYPCDPEAKTWSVPMEHTTPEFPGALVLGQELPMVQEVKDAFDHALKFADVVTISSIKEEPAFLTANKFKIKSQMYMALVPSHGKPWLFGVHQCSGERKWTPDEIQLFRMIGHRLRDALSKMLFQHELQTSETKFRSIFETAMVGLIVISEHSGNITEWNEGASKIFGYSSSEAIDQPVTIIIPDYLKEAHQTGVDLAKDHRKLLHVGLTHTLTGLHKNGYEFPIELTLGSWINDGTLYFCGHIVDITERKKAEEKLLHQAHFDSLTNLPNRFLSLDRLTQLMQISDRNQHKIAVAFLDLDDFKKVNDTLGHDTGDKLLIESAARLKNVVRKSDTVGRLGGDEFIILLGGLKQAIDARAIAENILGCFREAFNIEGRKLIMTASIGIAVYPGNGNTPGELLKNADSAMYHAKKTGRNNYSWFTASMNEEISRRLSLEEQLDGALARNEFSIYYQPKVQVSTKKITGAEALIRWYNPKLGNVSPLEFISIIEQTGAIMPIGKFVIKDSLAMSARWQKQYDKEFRIAINLSPRQFRDPDLALFIESALKESRVAGQTLELEITEGALLSGQSFVHKSLKAISELNVNIAMDDFGTGYSSLAYLREYPFNIIKIDKSFINEMASNKSDRDLVYATIAMAKALDLKVVAEGVETSEQFEFIQRSGCDFAQGYLFGKPMPAAEMESLLANAGHQTW